MLREMTWREFEEWVEFFRREPFDETRQDYRIAQLVATLINVNRSKKQSPVTVDKVRILFGDEEEVKPRQTVKEQQQIGQMYANFFNALEEEKQAKKEQARDRRKSRNTIR